LNVNLNQVTLPAVNIAESKRFYQLLGLRLIVDAPDYARFEFPDGDSTLSISLSEGPSASGSESVHVYFECDDLDDRIAELQARGVAFEEGPEDKRWLWREAWLKDPSDNLICLYNAGLNRKNPPWRVSQQ
jgi:catechol 2,3-dioxygenase-like lactoylglutathione lyase family enzyme